MPNIYTHRHLVRTIDDVPSTAAVGDIYIIKEDNEYRIIVVPNDRDQDVVVPLKKSEALTDEQIQQVLSKVDGYKKSEVDAMIARASEEPVYSLGSETRLGLYRLASIPKDGIIDPSVDVDVVTPAYLDAVKSRTYESTGMAVLAIESKAGFCVSGDARTKVTDGKFVLINKKPYEIKSSTFNSQQNLTSFVVEPDGLVLEDAGGMLAIEVDYVTHNDNANVPQMATVPSGGFSNTNQPNASDTMKTTSPNYVYNLVQYMIREAGGIIGGAEYVDSGVDVGSIDGTGRDKITINMSVSETLNKFKVGDFIRLKDSNGNTLILRISTITQHESESSKTTISVDKSIPTNYAGADIEKAKDGGSGTIIPTPSQRVQRIDVIVTPNIIKPGESSQAIANIYPYDVENRTIKWKVNDNTVATINESTGEINANANGRSGSIIVTATAQDGSNVSGSAALVVAEVQALVTGVVVSIGALTLKAGSTTKAVATNPDTGATLDVEWSSSNQDVATVNQAGLITAKGAGNATIYATAKDGSGKQGSKTISVTRANIKTFTAGTTDWVVPDNVKTIYVDAVGGGGGGGAGGWANGASGGNGANGGSSTIEDLNLGTVLLSVPGGRGGLGGAKATTSNYPSPGGLGGAGGSGGGLLGGERGGSGRQAYLIEGGMCGGPGGGGAPGGAGGTASVGVDSALYSGQAGGESTDPMQIKSGVVAGNGGDNSNGTGKGGRGAQAYGGGGGGGAGYASGSYAGGGGGGGGAGASTTAKAISVTPGHQLRIKPGGGGGGGGHVNKNGYGEDGTPGGAGTSGSGGIGYYSSNYGGNGGINSNGKNGGNNSGGGGGAPGMIIISW